MSTLKHAGLYKCFFSHENGKFIKEVRQHDNQNVQMGASAKYLLPRSLISFTKRYENKGPNAPGRATQKALETGLRVFKTQCERMDENDPEPAFKEYPEIVDGVPTGRTMRWKTSNHSRQEHIFKPCGKTYPGAGRKFTSDCMRDLKMDSEAMENDFLEILSESAQKYAQGKSTLSIENNMNTSTSAKALHDFIFTLRLNGIVPQAFTRVAMIEATLKLLNLPDIIVGQLDTKTGEIVPISYKKEEYVKLVCTIKPVLKCEEKGKKERRAIWVITMPLKILLDAMETASKVFLIRTPYDCITYGGAEKDSKIYSVINDVAVNICNHRLVISSDKTKWNETIVFESMWECLDTITADWSDRCRVMVLTPVKLLCTKRIILPNIRIYHEETGEFLEASVDSLSWEQLSAKWKEDCFDNDEGLFYEFKREFEVCLANIDKLIFTILSFMGMGLGGLISTVSSVVAVHQAKRQAKEGVIVKFLIASDDAIICIGAPTLELAMEMAQLIMAYEKMMGITTSGPKSLMQHGLSGSKPMGEYTTYYVHGSDNQTPASQKAMIINGQAEDLATAIKTMSTAPKDILGGAGLMPAFASIELIKRYKRLFLCSGMNIDGREDNESSDEGSDDESNPDKEEFARKLINRFNKRDWDSSNNESDDSDFERRNKLLWGTTGDTEPSSKRQKISRAVVLEDLNIKGKCMYTCDDQFTGPLTCGAPEEVGIRKGIYDPYLVIASNRRPDQLHGIDPRMKLDEYGGYNLRPPSSLNYMKRQTKHEANVHENTRKAAIVKEAFHISNPRLAASRDTDVVVDDFLISYLNDNKDIATGELKNDIERVIEVYNRTDKDDPIRKNFFKAIGESWKDRHY